MLHVKKDSDNKILLPTKDSDICFLFPSLYMHIYHTLLYFLLTTATERAIKATALWNNTSTEQPFEDTVIMNKAKGE